MAQQTGFSAGEATLIATAISELARNIVSYANQGSVTLKPVHGPNGATGLTIVASDSGPGLPTSTSHYATAIPVPAASPGVARRQAPDGRV